MREFGNRLCQLRKGRCLTQAELAHHLHISPSAIGNYEMGERIPKTIHLMAICSFFSVSSDYLFGIESYPSDIIELLERLKTHYKYEGNLQCNGASLDSSQIERLFDFLLLSANVIISEKGKTLL